MIHEDKPSLEEALEHHGIKGMRWGVRKSNDSSNRPNHARAKKIAKVAGVTALVGGAAVATYLLTKNGHLPVAEAFARSVKTGIPTGPKTRIVGTATKVHPAVNHVLASNGKKLVRDITKEIADANASQDQWMRSIGLGAVVNNAK